MNFPMIYILFKKIYLARRKEREQVYDHILLKHEVDKWSFTFFPWVWRIRAGPSAPHSSHPEEVTAAYPIPSDIAAKGSLQPLHHSVVNDFSPCSMVQNMMNQGTMQRIAIQKKYWTRVGQWRWHTANITALHNHHTSHVHCLQYW